ncbi:MAG: hypothetical protein JXQ77_03425 [Campylobacterales bacterium]|nr:hypothetical protein [Campylobacterales bacterium]
MKEYLWLALIIVSIFAITLAGAIFSQSFSEQMTYIELFTTMGSLLFVVSVLVVAAILGFSSFALYMAVMVAIIMVFLGIEAVVLMIGISYSMWGFIFAMQLLLFEHGSAEAKEWFANKYTHKSFLLEYRFFYPLLGIVYLLLEYLPHFIYRDNITKFNPAEIAARIDKTLKR